MHRAFSVFVFRLAGTELLLQQRSRHKPLFPLRWANTCCSHPFPAEASVVQAAERRLYQEFGFSVGLREAGAFVYRAKDPEADFSEYEHDSVLIGAVDGPIELNPDRAEIAAWRWMAVSDLRRTLRENSAAYAPWLDPALRIALAAQRLG